MKNISRKINDWKPGESVRYFDLVKLEDTVTDHLLDLIEEHARATGMHVIVAEATVKLKASVVVSKAEYALAVDEGEGEEVAEDG